MLKAQGIGGGGTGAGDGWECFGALGRCRKKFWVSVEGVQKEAFDPFWGLFEPQKRVKNLRFDPLHPPRPAPSLLWGEGGDVGVVPRMVGWGGGVVPYLAVPNRSM